MAGRLAVDESRVFRIRRVEYFRTPAELDAIHVGVGEDRDQAGAAAWREQQAEARHVTQRGADAAMRDGHSVTRCRNDGVVRGAHALPDFL